MDSNRNSYSNIFKAIGLFGSVKIFQIIVNVLKAKAIAVLIGPSGMGLVGLFQSTLDLVNQVTGCGLQTSAVREVSKSLAEGNNEKIGLVISTLHRLVWLTGSLGMVIVFFMSPFLSKFAFGRVEYASHFRYLSIVLLLMQLNTGQIALLQGTFRYRDMAKASLWGAFYGLLVVCPIYFFLKEEGIVVAIVAAAVVTLFFSWKYARVVEYKKYTFQIKNFLDKSKGMMHLGIVLALGTTMGTASGYLMNIFLSGYGNTAIVGLYSAAFQIANSYVLLVLSAMSSDYIPRLSSMNGDNLGQIDAINKQVVLVMIIIVPLLNIFMLFSKEIVVLLYSSEFASISSLITLLMFGMVFRATSWCLSYSLIARGDSKAFLLCEIIASVASLCLKILGYILGGFEGMGLGFVLTYILYTLVLYVVSSRVFDFSFNVEFYHIFVPSLILTFACLMICLIPMWYYMRLCIGIVIILLATHFAFTELKKRVDINLFTKCLRRR